MFQRYSWVVGLTATFDGDTKLSQNVVTQQPYPQIKQQIMADKGSLNYPVTLTTVSHWLVVPCHVLSDTQKTGKSAQSPQEDSLHYNFWRSFNVPLNLYLVYIRFLWVLATLPVNFQKRAFVCRSCHLPKKVGLYPRNWGKVRLHSKISDFSVQNMNFIAKMTTISSSKA